MGIRVTAKFVGQDGSMGYWYGQVYELTIRGKLAKSDDACCPTPYTVEGFLSNWVILDAENMVPA